MNQLRFLEACQKVIDKDRERNGIGTLSEKTIHAVLKNYFEPHEENHEIKMGSFVADIVGENGIIEIQTRNFSLLNRKLDCFLEFANVTVVYPMAHTKYLRWIDADTGEVSKPRKSPKAATIYGAVPELYKIKFTLDNPLMNLCICMLDIEETRYLNGWSKDKKRGSSRCDGKPIALADEIYFRCVDDYRQFIPDGLGEKYTSADFAKKAHISRAIAQITLNILTYLELVERIGKASNNIIYRTSEK